MLKFRPLVSHSASTMSSCAECVSPWPSSGRSAVAVAVAVAVERRQPSHLLSTDDLEPVRRQSLAQLHTRADRVQPPRARIHQPIDQREDSLAAAGGLGGSNSSLEVRKSRAEGGGAARPRPCWALPGVPQTLRSEADRHMAALRARRRQRHADRSGVAVERLLRPRACSTQGLFRLVRENEWQGSKCDCCVHAPMAGAAAA